MVRYWGVFAFAILEATADWRAESHSFFLKARSKSVSPFKIVFLLQVISLSAGSLAPD
jgi:hypothetical protein